MLHGARMRRNPSRPFRQQPALLPSTTVPKASRKSNIYSKFFLLRTIGVRQDAALRKSWLPRILAVLFIVSLGVLVTATITFTLSWSYPPAPPMLLFLKEQVNYGLSSSSFQTSFLSLTTTPDSGGIRRRSTPSRIIINDFNDAQAYEKERDELLETMDYTEYDEYFDGYEDRDVNINGCIRLKWTFDMNVTCNTLHEVPVSPVDASIDNPPFVRLGAGFFRQADYYSDSHNDSPGFVLKRIRYDDELHFNTWFFASIRNEALVMEKLSDSPYIGNLYGFCGMSSLVQHGQPVTHEILPMNEDSTTQLPAGSINTLTTEQRLDWAIQMTSAIAEMHGFRDGVIVHDDVHPEQWMSSRPPDNPTHQHHSLFLNDINNAVPLDWHVNEQRYCRYHVSYSGGTFRAPEEYSQGEQPIDESVDVYAMGNVIFALMSGRSPFYNESSEERVQELLQEGVVPTLPNGLVNKSSVEAEMMNIMKSCHKFDPKARSDTFSVLAKLKELQNRLAK